MTVQKDLMTIEKQNRKVIVCQRGARHRYAIPRMFEGEGMLAALYTDSTTYSPAGRLARLAGRLGLDSKVLSALTARKPEGLPKHLVKCSDRPLIASVLHGLIREELSKTYIRWGLGGASVVYSMYGEDFGFLLWSKAHGAKIVVDVFVHPSTNTIIADEETHFLPEVQRDGENIEKENRHTVRLFELADILLCPSQWVAEGVRSFSPECADKIRVVPYGSSLQIRSSINENPCPGRCFFAGREALRKGLHYLAEAAHLIRASGTDIDVRVAGVDQGDIKWMEHGGELNCLGRLPMDQMHREYEEADVFVLPSLSEGQAGVLLEAMACGCPVVATRESGVDFSEGCGITVPARNAVALASILGDIITDRSLRNRLAEGALRQSQVFSMEQWKQRLIQVVDEVLFM